MTDKEKKERESTILEIQSRKEVLKKIDNAYKRLKQQAEAQYEKRKAKVQAASEYDSIEDAHTAYGYDCITENEYYEIVKYLSRVRSTWKNIYPRKKSQSKFSVNLLED